MAKIFAQIKGALLNEMLHVVAHALWPAKCADMVLALSRKLRMAITHHAVLDGTWYGVKEGNAIPLASYPPSADLRTQCRMFGRPCIKHFVIGVHLFLGETVSTALTCKHANSSISA